MWLRVLILVGLAALVAYPFWRVTRKPVKTDANFYDTENNHFPNAYSTESDHTGGDAGGHH